MVAAGSGVKVQEKVGNIEWALLTPEVIGAMLPSEAAGIANGLFAGNSRSGIRRINPRNPPNDVVAVLQVLAALKARANVVEFEVVQEGQK